MGGLKKELTPQKNENSVSIHSFSLFFNEAPVVKFYLIQIADEWQILHFTVLPKINKKQNTD